MEQSRRGITGSSLKIIAIVAMFIDHFAAIFIERYLMFNAPGVFTTTEQVTSWSQKNPMYGYLYFAYNIMRFIGRFAFPIFCFLLVEGMGHTRSIAGYARNLAIFALISELPFDLGFSGKLVNREDQNVFFTLLIGLLVIWSLQVMGEKKRSCPKWMFGISYLLFGGVCTYLVGRSEIGGTFKTVINKVALQKLSEGAAMEEVSSFMITGEFCVIFGTLFLALILLVLQSRKWGEERKIRFSMGMPVVCAGVLLADLLKTDYGCFGVLTIVVMYLFRENRRKEMEWGCLLLTIMNLIEGATFLMVGPVLRYNGKRGLKLKYAFYAFYPVHLLLIHFLSCSIGLPAIS